MISLIETYEVKADAKARVKLPSGLRKELQPIINEGFVLKRNIFDKCLELFPMSEWNKETESLGKLNRFVKENNDFIRAFMAGVRIVNIDAAGRIQIPKDLVNYAGIKKNLVISSAINRLEIWDKDTKYTSSQLDLAMTLANQAAVALDNARLYEEQRKTAEELRELDKLKSQFLANMSHELRTPLNSIIGFSRVIMKGIDGPITDIQEQDLSAIYNAGHHLLKMINDILDISKIDAGKMELTFEDVYLPDIIESVMSTARGLIKDKPVRLITAIADDLPTITADSTRVRQILLNLISNSAKFTDEGSITVTARKQTGANGQPEIYISVTDTGIGITPEDSKKLFQPFVQVDGSPTRKTGGTGLGLSITRLLVELHGGEINLESDIGKGSTFYFTLPVHGKKAQPVDGESSAVVLSIDNDPRVIQLYEQYLSNSRYQITPLTDPSRAIELAREIQPFAITLDIMLPGHDGWQILQGLQEDPETKHIPIIICSILEDTGKGLKLGAHEYLTKPILKDDLMRALNRIKS